MHTSYLLLALLPPVDGSPSPLPTMAGGVPPISLALEFLFFSDLLGICFASRAPKDRQDTKENLASPDDL